MIEKTYRRYLEKKDSDRSRLRSRERKKQIGLPSFPAPFHFYAVVLTRCSYGTIIVGSCPRVRNHACRYVLISAARFAHATPMRVLALLRHKSEAEQGRFYRWSEPHVTKLLFAQYSEAYGGFLSHENFDAFG